MTGTPTIYYADMLTPIGNITVARTHQGLCKILLSKGDTGQSSMEYWIHSNFLKTKKKLDQGALADIKEQLNEYFNGLRPTFECELDLIGTPFQKKVWHALLDIPYGEVRSYKDIAQKIGSPKAVRAVGAANNKNNIPLIIPCHRVIGSNGAMVGYGFGIDVKKQLLELEGYNDEHNCMRA
jgi:methylated-DNA-[protein]-cysteine S-methyltransferase